MDPHEIKLVRQYAINEVAGGILLAMFALRAADPAVRSKLTYHAMDELRHGWLWTEYLDQQGVGVASAKGRNEYFDYAATLTDELEFLAAVHIYELRIPFHLGAHLTYPAIGEGLKKVMGPICDDEKFHLGWIRKYLIAKMKEEPERVLKVIQNAEQKEKETYIAYLDHIGSQGGYLAGLAEHIRSKLPEFPPPSTLFSPGALNA